jgi:hypothetical protein
VATPEDVYGITAECRRLIEHAQATGWSDPAVQSELGSIWDYQQQIDGLVGALPLAPPGPTPEPLPPGRYLGFGVTYPAHGEALDAYLGRTDEEREWGPHHGLELFAPAAGRVEAYQFPTPLQARRAADPAYARRYDELFGAGWVCVAPPAAVRSGRDGLLIGSQVMYVAVLWLDVPLLLRNGRSLRALWLSHVRGDIATGRVAAGARICTSWDSGIRFENNGIAARGAHVHVCGTATGTLSMNGDVPGLYVAEALGWQVEYRGADGPGPDQYMTGRWVGGKPQAAWRGRALPPIPA